MLVFFQEKYLWNKHVPLNFDDTLWDLAVRLFSAEQVLLP